MKANRQARHNRSGGSFMDDERGVSEIVGYMIAFAMGSVILVLSLTGFNAMRDYSGDMVADRTVNEVALRISFAVDESLQSGAQHPVSEFSREIRLPEKVSGNTFGVELGPKNVWVNTTDAGPVVKDGDGNDLETMGRANVTFIPRAPPTRVLCGQSDTDTSNWEEGGCTGFSGDAKLIVKYGRPDPAEPDLQGVYLVRP